MDHWLCRGRRSQVGHWGWRRQLCQKPLQSWGISCFPQRGDISMIVECWSYLFFCRQAKVWLSALRTTNTVQEISGMDDGAASGLLPSMGAKLKLLGCSKSRSVVKRSHSITIGHITNAWSMGSFPNEAVNIMVLRCITMRKGMCSWSPPKRWTCFSVGWEKPLARPLGTTKGLGSDVGNVIYSGEG